MQYDTRQYMYRSDKKQAEDGSFPRILPLNHHSEPSDQQKNDGLAHFMFFFFLFKRENLQI